MIVEEADRGITPEGLEQFESGMDRSLKFREIREQWYFDWVSTDLYLIIDNPCYYKECIRKRIEYYKDNFQLAGYNYYIQQAEALALNPYAMDTAKHRYYENLIADLIIVVEAFNTQYENDKWNEVKQEYLEKYRDYGAEAGADPLGFAIETTLTPIIKVGTDIITNITKATATGLSQSLFGENWKTKLAIIGGSVLGITILGLIGYHSLKTYGQEKIKTKIQEKIKKKEA